MSDLSTAVRDLRHTLSMTREQFAAELKVGLASIRRWEIGSFEPRFDARLAMYFKAKTAGRDDLANIFMAGQAPQAARSAPGAMIVRVQPALDESFLKAELLLEQAVLKGAMDKAKHTSTIQQAIVMLKGGRELLQMATETAS
jgi:transcriptional regulator with XRE-family HTH domain